MRELKGGGGGNQRSSCVSPYQLLQKGHKVASVLRPLPVQCDKLLPEDLLRPPLRRKNKSIDAAIRQMFHETCDAKDGGYFHFGAATTKSSGAAVASGL